MRNTLYFLIVIVDVDDDDPICSRFPFPRKVGSLKIPFRDHEKNEFPIGDKMSQQMTDLL